MTFTTIDPEFKTKWLKALRSGRYKQTTGVLRRANSTNGYGYCCLGVACNLESSRKWKPDENAGAGKFAWNGFGARKDDSFPEFGLDEGVTTHLIQMNDGGSSFEEIADWIEENL